ncbi:N-acetylmuramoyl-L-alanine amidase [Mergibacter septicus]|uniref:N-acetylmuramoyl-L-alanine amidase n=1 Tax=Mergibacter septicus TaxID=221402 RepID=UPI0011790A09|nr:N-acetylmuramoyl-L-alanine amidase [Mergibacter septicus]AWX14258.1 N-acetylmuramoyl-L-alanine amidase [Mergibacter septicus]
MSNIDIHTIVIHCSATQNGVKLARNGKTAAQRIDEMHAQRGFKRRLANYQHFNPHLRSIGYHFVIDTDGTIETGRREGEIGAHVKGFNVGSLGICLVGGIGSEAEKSNGRYTQKQWQSLKYLIQELAERYPDADLVGHRDLSPDLNNDGVIMPNEWVKTCPGFDVYEYVDNDLVPTVDHIVITGE